MADLTITTVLLYFLATIEHDERFWNAEHLHVFLVYACSLGPSPAVTPWPKSDGS